MIQKIALVTLLMSAATAHADFVCQGDSPMGPVIATVHGSTVTIEGADLVHPAVFNNVSDYWDGHMTGLITAPGLALRYANDYGCIRNVELTTNLRSSGTEFLDSVSFASCKSDQGFCGGQ